MIDMNSRLPYSSHNRSGNAALGALLALGLFGIVMGFMFFSYNVAEEELDLDAAQEADTGLVQTEIEAESVQLPAQTAVAGQQELVIGESDVQPMERETAAVEPEAVPEMSVSDRIEAYLAAGEFAPAMELALQTENVDLQTALLNKIAKAQWESAEFQTELAQVRRGSEDFDVAANAQPQNDTSFAGGGAGADFGPLMDLIQNQTTGPWIDVEGTGGSMSPFGDTTGGVSVDPNGVMANLQRADRTKRLASVGWAARNADLSEDMNRPSELRLVSLTRLERELAGRLAQGQPVLETMKHLAGLTSVQYVFVLPEQNEILIGGPAEGWSYNEAGMALGEESGRPTLQLDDLVNVLRVFSSDGAQIFTCSIDPRPEGLQELKSYLERTNGQALSPAAMRQRVKHYQDLLGLQNVTIKGVPADSRIARVIAEADYRMKLIGIDKLDAGEQIPSFFDLLAQNSGKLPSSLDALRWWLTMKYDAVLYSQDRDVFELQGSSVQCLSENEYINKQGQRVQSGQSEATNRAFARSFTENYASLAKKDPVFADLQNVFDLALVAALVHRENLDQRAQWDRGVFASTGRFETERFEAPKSVMSVVNHRVYNGSDVVIQVAGGVRGDLLAVVKDSQTFKPGLRLDSVKNRSNVIDVPANRWWWDAR